MEEITGMSVENMNVAWKIDRGNGTIDFTKICIQCPGMLKRIRLVTQDCLADALRSFHREIL